MLYDYSNGIISVIFPQAGDVEPDAEQVKDGVRAKFATPDMDLHLNEWQYCYA